MKQTARLKRWLPSDPEVLCPAAGVFLAARPDLEKRSNFSGGEQLCDDRQDGVIAVAVGDGDFDVLLLAGGHDFIGLTRRATEGFLEVNGTRSGGNGGEAHGVVLIDVARSDGHDVGFRLGEHSAVVAKALHPTQPLARRGEADRIGVGDGDDQSAECAATSRRARDRSRRAWCGR